MMLALEGEVSEVYLQPGESHLAHQATIIRTILGSCVGISFWSARLGIGGLCHCQLPRWPAKPTAPLSPVIRRRYVDFAIRDFARQFDELGASRSEVQVKLFGGADVLVVNNSISSKPTVGKLNCLAAIEVVEAEGFAVVASSLGGTSGLNIQFDTRTGEVCLRRLHRVVFEDILQE
ncbi:MAG: chemotaxis protein CheD [Candidatus Sulfotelmatobacter sp.]